MYRLYVSMCVYIYIYIYIYIERERERGRERERESGPRRSDAGAAPASRRGRSPCCRRRSCAPS